jgi:hypothetical protein
MRPARSWLLSRKGIVEARKLSWSVFLAFINIGAILVSHPTGTESRKIYLVR